MKRIVYLCTAAVLLAFASCSSNNISGHDYVDLGLPSGLKWATCNVGADSPSEYGNYYAWGEIAPKESYNVENSLTWGQGIGEISGNPQYDAARANWGSTWRMPTITEFEELRKECEWEWTNEGGNNGYKVTGPNGNSIFFPAAGDCLGVSLLYEGSHGNYWSSTSDEFNTQLAYYLYFYSNGRYTHWSGRRGYGQSVRPVSGTHVTTKEVTGITEMTATCGGEVTDSGGVEITERGVCWSTNQNPTIMDSHTTDGKGTGNFTSNIMRLSAGTTYYVRAYAVTKDGIQYGIQKCFTMPNRQINGHEYVNLGLPSGLKWATCNVGADSPSEYGNYYAWGEIATKTSYTEENSLTWGQGIGEISGNSQYDAARSNWGDAWRMPTKEEFEELLNNCTWIWTTQDGNYGYKVTGPNDNSIFLPAVGRRTGTSLDRAGSCGYFWSSTPNESFTLGAYGLGFNRGNRGTDWDYRSVGLSVRPVSE